MAQAKILTVGGTNYEMIDDTARTNATTALNNAEYNRQGPDRQVPGPVARNASRGRGLRLRHHLRRAAQARAGSELQRHARGRLHRRAARERVKRGGPAVRALPACALRPVLPVRRQRQGPPHRVHRVSARRRWPRPSPAWPTIMLPDVEHCEHPTRAPQT